MGSVTLHIDSPAHGATFVGAAADAVRLRGHAEAGVPVPLHYKWYSSLHDPGDIASAEEAALSRPCGDPLDCTVALRVGAHVLTFTAKDRPGDALADLQAVQYAGQSGGVPETGAPCVVHVFRARIVEQAPEVSRAAAVLSAEAPLKWGRKADGTYERDPDYHALNRVRYRWRFVPAGGGDAVGLPAADADDAAMAAFQEGLRFRAPEAEGDPPEPRVRYEGSLPGDVTAGDYTLVLRVEDAAPPHAGHEATTALRVIA